MYVIGKIVYGWDFTKESGLDYSYLGKNCNNLAQLLEEKRLFMKFNMMNSMNI